MDNIERIKEYINQELSNFEGNIDSLELDKKQLETFIEELNNLSDDVSLNNFSPIFDKYQFSMSFNKTIGALNLISFFNKLNTTDIPQYKDALNDLEEVKQQVNNFINEIDIKIQFIKSNQEKIDDLKKCLSVLDKYDENYVFNEEELDKLFNTIMLLSLSSIEKYDLIYDITSKNVEKKVFKIVDKSISNSDDDIVSICIEENIGMLEGLLEDADDFFESNGALSDSEIIEYDEITDDELFNKIKEIINVLSKYYMLGEYELITNDTGILERKVIYSENSKISKYNWPMIYTDLCNNIIPKYKAGIAKDEIRELFEFIIEKFNNYESVFEQLDENIIIEVKNYLKIVEDVNEDEIRNLYRQLHYFNDCGVECENICKIAGSNSSYTNDQVKMYFHIFELRDGYDEYLLLLESEVNNRFSSDLASIINDEEEMKLFIKDTLVKIKEIEQKINANLFKTLVDIDGDSRKNDNNEDDNVEVNSLENKDPCNLVLFMPSSHDEDSFSNIVNNILSQGNSQITLRNIINIVYTKLYMCSNYVGMSKTKTTGYMKLNPRELDPKNDYRYLELYNMCRARKSSVRCCYCVLDVSENNKKILRNFYPNFDGVLFLVTGIFYKANDDAAYIGKTNKFIRHNQAKIDEIIQLFKNDFESPEKVERALSIINGSLSQYNDVCSKCSKKVGDK